MSVKVAIHIPIPQVVGSPIAENYLKLAGYIAK
jgi:hypothetical protein